MTFSVTRTARAFLLVLSLLVVPAAAAQTPYLGSPVQLPGTVQAENYDRGGQGVAWYDTTPGNAFGAVYRTDDMDVGAIGNGGYHIGGLADGEWAKYTVSVPAGGAFDVTVHYSSAYPGPNTFRLLDVTGGAATNLTGTQTLASTGSWTTYLPRTYRINLASGTRLLRLAFDAGAWNVDRLVFTTVSCTVPTITMQPVPTATDCGVPCQAPPSGQQVIFKGSASGSPAPTFQWFKNGQAFSGGTVQSPPPGQPAGTTWLTINNIEHARDIGSYTFKASNSCGTTTSSTAQIIRVPCAGPDDSLENVNRLLNPVTGVGDRCDWTKNVNQFFPDTFGGGKGYNEPVIAATTALIKEPVRSGVWDMNTWWPKYLQGELGDRGTAWYYGGEEFGSYNYQRYNVAAVLAVHYHANRTNNTVIRDLARRWLRATFALQALAAMPNKPATLHAQGQTQFVSTPYAGPYVAMAGDRSSWGFWVDPYRSTMFAQAIGQPSNAGGERQPFTGIRTRVATWSGAWGLSATEQAELRRTVNEGIAPPNLVANYLGSGLRVKMVYHFAGWAGVKATLMEDFANPNTTPTLGVAYFTNPKFANGNEAHFLYPWAGLWADADNRNHRHCFCHGWTKLELPITSMSTWHPDCWCDHDGNSSTAPILIHPEMLLTIDGLPSPTPNYHVTLRPDQPPIVR